MSGQSSRPKSFNPKAKAFNPGAKAFNPSAAAFNPTARAFEPGRGLQRATSAPPGTLGKTKSNGIHSSATPAAPSTPSFKPFLPQGASAVRATGYTAPKFSGGVGIPPTHDAKKQQQSFIPQGYMDAKMGQMGGQWGMQGMQGGMMQGGLQGGMRVPPMYAGPGGMTQMGAMHPGVVPQYEAEPMGTEEMEGFDWERERAEQKRILLPLRRPVSSLFMPENLVERFTMENQMLTARLQPEHRDFYRLPMTVDHERYHSLWPLPPEFDATPTTYAAQCYKVTSTKDGLHYILRRVTGNHSEKYAAKAIAPWIRIHQLARGSHPNIVAVRTVFESQDFDEVKSLCLIYDYHPSSIPLAAEYQMRDAKKGMPSRGVVSEQILWSYLNQILTALTSVHPQGLALMNINPYRVLTQSHRLRINFCGLSEALQDIPRGMRVEELQFNDLKDMCRVLMSVACRCHVNDANSEKAAFEVMSQSYSEDLVGLFKLILFTPHKKLPTAWEIQSSVWHRLVDELQNAYSHIDYLNNQLAKEHQNGRLFSLIAKLGFINERPEHRNNPKWSETGDRYLCKLFRDFIFHTVDESGRPQIDLGHVVSCLNKLDAASAEKTLLTSRNQDSLLIVSYKELNRCITSAFQELRDAAMAEVKTNGPRHS